MATMILGLMAMVANAQEPGGAGGQEPNAGQAEKAPLRVRMGGAVQAAKMTHKVEPIYPPLARQTRISGTVRLKTVVGKDGKVKQLEVISGHPLLVQAALDAVRQWEYRPTTLNGEAVEVETTIDVIFALNDGKSSANAGGAAASPGTPKEVKILRSSDADDPAFRADLLKLMEVTRATENGTAALKKFMVTFRPMLFRSVTDETRRQALISSFEDRLAEILKSDIYRDGIVIAYSKYFTDDDLKALIEFYQTPTGMKFNDVMPSLMNDVMTLGQNLGQEKTPEILKQMCKENPDLAGHIPNCEPHGDKTGEVGTSQLPSASGR